MKIAGPALTGLLLVSRLHGTVSAAPGVSVGLEETGEFCCWGSSRQVAAAKVAFLLDLGRVEAAEMEAVQSGLWDVAEEISAADLKMARRLALVEAVELPFEMEKFLELVAKMPDSTAVEVKHRLVEACLLLISGDVQDAATHAAQALLVEGSKGSVSLTVCV